MNILITGGNGQLGKDCENIFSQSHSVTSVDIEDIDITDFDRLNTAIATIGPDVIINCAAFTNVDACETQTEAAWAVNVTGPENLSICASNHGALIIHISSDYVFDGKKEPPDTYEETDPVGPLSYYGKTKLEGENAVKTNAKNFILLRTAWLYGFNGHNFLKAILKKALANPEQPLKIVNDQYGSPTWSYRLAHQIRNLIDHNGQGLYHASSEGFCTWYELANYFLEKIGVTCDIAPCTTKEYPLPATRPGCAILENKRLKTEGLNLMESWQTDLDLYIDQYGAQLISECHA
jgi:dTDP-4-dehydrorhamnose reductase